MPAASGSMTRLTALAAGSEVPAGDFAFSVHSAFGAAMNLAVAGRRGLVTLVGADAADYPQGIRLATRECFDAWPVPVGTRGHREGVALVFDGPDGGELFAIDLSAAVTAQRQALPRLDPSDEALREARAVCAAHLDGLQEAKGTDLRLAAVCGRSSPPTSLGRNLVEAAHELAGGVGDRNADAAASAASRLMGLGTGLTPTGDDFLCGLLAALWCASGEGSPERQFVVEWGTALSARLDSTNAISATFLECAIAGSFPGAVSALAAAVAGSHAGHAHEDAREALDGLCALGHSSGMDIATGFLFGLWLRTDEEMRRHAPQL